MYIFGGGVVILVESFEPVAGGHPHGVCDGITKGRFLFAEVIRRIIVFFCKGADDQLAADIRIAVA